MAYKSKNITVRVSEEWLSTLERLLNVVSEGQSHDRSRLIRQLVSEESAFWLDSPYVALSSEYFILISGDRTGYYRMLQRLQLEAMRAKLPCIVKIKPERQEAWIQRYRGVSHEADLIRDHWLINHFAVWLGEDTSSDPLASHVDRHGITGKLADLDTRQAKGTRLTREIIVANRDFVQRKRGDDFTADRADIGIDIPTLNVDIIVVVDLDLYEGAATPILGYELRNREGARLEERQPGSEANKIDWVEERYPEAAHVGPAFGPTLNSTKEAFDAFRNRVQYLAAEGTFASDGRQVVESEETRRKLRSIELPERFLFGRLRWQMPLPSLQVCLTWNKPT